MNERASLLRRPVGLGVIVGLGLFALEGSAEAAVAYVRSEIGGSPWGSTANEEAMDLVFGAGNWHALRFETVTAATLFSDTYTFIYLEGSDVGAEELVAFLGAHQPQLEAWVDAGGALLLNSGPNEGTDQSWGFGGVVLTANNISDNPGAAVNASHPIWNGPFLPMSTSFEGGSYAHASVAGPSLTSLFVDASGDVNLAERASFGAGRAIFGGLTTSNFWMPTPEALNMRANVIAYLADADGDEDGLVDAVDNCPSVANAGQANADDDALGDDCDDCPDDAENDVDEDLACDGTDNCVGLSNPTQTDEDDDGVGNACDACTDDADNDADGDGLCGDVDNCPDVVNVNQADDDDDGVGNICDPCGDDVNDPDGDGTCDSTDNCPGTANDDQADADHDGQGDACDACPDDGDDDADGDGVCGDVDNCPDDANATQDDADGDGVGDACDGGVDDTAGSSGPDGTATGGDDLTGPGTGEGTDSNATGGQNGGDGGGCGCTAEHRAAPVWLVLALPLLMRRRRAEQ